MGNSTSTDEDPLDPFDGIDTLGYRVLGVQPDSPAAKAGLVSFLDFLVGANSKMLLGSGEELEPGQEYDDVDLPALLEENKDKEIEFLVWNIKSQTARLVNLTPSDTWGGAGLLGVTIRLDNYAGAEDRLVRVLRVEPNGPAAVCGLQAETDFLLGTTHQTLSCVDTLAVDVLQEHVDQVVELYVYNATTDVVRVVALLPTYSWDGEGLLGAEVGTGYLHRLPSAARATAGTSVERKVRYVDAVDTTASGDAKTTKVLQQEPQLEMEASDVDDDDDVESVALETPPVATSRKKEPASGAAAPKAPPALPAASAANNIYQTPEKAAVTPAVTPAAETKPQVTPPQPGDVFGMPPPDAAPPQRQQHNIQQSLPYNKPPPQQQTPYESAAPSNYGYQQPATTAPPKQQQQPSQQQPSYQQQTAGQHQQPPYQQTSYRQQTATTQQNPYQQNAAPPPQQHYQHYQPPPPPPQVNPYPPTAPNGTNNAPSPLGPPPKAYYGAAHAPPPAQPLQYNNSYGAAPQHQAYGAAYGGVPPQPVGGAYAYGGNTTTAASLPPPPTQYAAHR